jgi:hypothetical protein
LLQCREGPLGYHHIQVHDNCDRGGGCHGVDGHDSGLELVKVENYNYLKIEYLQFKGFKLVFDYYTFYAISFIMLGNTDPLHEKVTKKVCFYLDKMSYNK